jgi:hypothetical protein
MADVHSKEIRSKNMAAIKGKNTKPEMLVRRFLHANRYRYKLHDKSLPGKPDIIISSPDKDRYEIKAFAARGQGKTRGAMVFSLNFLVTFSFKRKSDK